MKICIVIPCYNEEKRLDVMSFQQYLQNTNHSICFVNDGSRDNTLEVLYSIKNMFPEKVEVFNLEQNKGKAEAVRNGLLFSMNWKEFEYIGYLDADLATPFEEVDYILSKIKNNHIIVMGSRVRRLGANIQRTITRHYLGRIFSTLASFILKIPIYDSQCGAKFIKTEYIQDIFNKPFITKWLFDIEIFARFKRKLGVNSILNGILEVPLNTWLEKSGSKLKITYLLKVPFELLRIKFTY